ncbi:hypothetical protein [Streptomyces sp. CoH17]|uniref:hypothetical protein n=1 Tax=Streptomyces sp. CoH17 TaxID=2992806 RepID=UPI002270A616|nr:hypothetical protein [Streptomyces sp. CoH17]
MAESQTRVGGGGWTTFSWRGTRLAWMQVLQDNSPTPVASAQPVQPLDAETPIEIVTPRAVGPGTLRLTNFELWNKQVWQQLPGLEKANGILDVFKTQVNLGNISCRKIIKRPSGGYKTKVMYGCTIVDVDDSETINLGTMLLPKGITVMYTDFNYV